MPALRFILGRAGSGKTHTCISEIADCLQEAPLGPPLLFILPDQATFQMERAIVQALPGQGFVRLRVLSFKRLALSILAEAGGLARPALTRTGRQMLLRSLLHEYGDRLQVFGRSARQPGFVAELEAMLRELVQCGHTLKPLRQPYSDYLTRRPNRSSKISPCSGRRIRRLWLLITPIPMPM